VLTDPNPPPAPVAPVIAPVCVGQPLSICIPNPLTTGTYHWTLPSGSTQTGPPCVTYTSATLIESGTYQVYVTENNCNSAITNIPVVVNPLAAAPIVTTPINYCQFQTAVLLTPNQPNNQWYDQPTGGTLLTTSAELTPATNQVGTTLYYVAETTTAGCQGPRAEVAVIVHPTPVIANTSTTICSGTSFTITPVGQGVNANTTYTWTAPLGNVTGGVAQPNPQSTIQGSLSNNSTIQQTATYTVTPTTPNSSPSGGCTGSPFDLVVTVNPVPTVQFSIPRDTICSGEQNHPMVMSTLTPNADIVVGSVLYNTINATTITPGTPTSIPIQTLNNPGVELDSVVYTIYAQTTGAAVCQGPFSTYVIYVKPLPIAQFAPDATNICSNTQVVFTNTSLGNASSYQWDFGDGSDTTVSTTASVTHTYNVGVYTTYTATLTATNDCGSDVYTVLINVTPSTIDLNWYIVAPTQFGCAPHTVVIENVSVGATSYTWNFGDGSSPVPGPPGSPITYVYDTPGVYTISVLASNGCTDTSGTKQVRVIRTPVPQFQVVNDNACPGSAVQFVNLSDTATNYTWTFGDPATGLNDTIRTSSGGNVSHVYSSPGVYTVTLTATLTDNTSAVSCPAVITHQVHVVAPDVQIVEDSPACVRDTVRFLPIVNTPIGLAPIRDTAWFINGVPYPVPASTYPRFSHVFTLPGVYTITLVVGTVNGCRDTASVRITVNQKPTISASTDQRICLGRSVQLNASSNAGNYQWDPSPNSGLSCYTCPNPIASPTTTTVYIVSTINTAGCRNRDTVKVTVIPPFQMDVQPLEDTICIGESVQLIANGAANYVWSPAYSLSCSRCPSPVATPPVTTVYTVIGSDGFNCFTDTARIRVAVGRYPEITLANPPTSQTGDSVLLQPQITNGPIRTYTWTPNIDLGCNDCPTPKAYIRRDRCYTLRAENIYGCADTATACVTAFCQNAQVFIPNAFTPGSSDINDRFYIQGRGFMIKHLRVFNRWGEVVFEANNVNPNDRSLDRAAWSGKVRGVMATSDVFVYMAEVQCDNGTSFTYKGNVTLIR
jgi:PKD repeat protein